jgi:[ribosomal protein S5]-alanine N-acetyltransferase
MNQIHLVSGRLTLRPVEFSDWEKVHILNSLPETNRYNPSGIPENIEQTKFAVEGWVNENQKDNNRHFTFAVEMTQTQEFIGLIALNLGKEKYHSSEIWYKLHRSFWGKGYATEAVTRILDFGFGPLQLHRIEAGCAVGNLASIRVLEKVGMKREGHRRQILPLASGWSDNYEFAILSSDWCPK